MKRYAIFKSSTVSYQIKIPFTHTTYYISEKKYISLKICHACLPFNANIILNNGLIINLKTKVMFLQSFKFLP